VLAGLPPAEGSVREEGEVFDQQLPAALGIPGGSLCDRAVGQASSALFTGPSHERGSRRIQRHPNLGLNRFFSSVAPSRGIDAGVGALFQ
jgi:hypothetical protein